ncbi:hypothetical protein [uncultured Enorma sp.]|uniref:hypothetical protein n=1 Tax=uncultured Enorma sp. TaxID=1714346 RepID=UPI0028046E13|nr:hypothetical protein [uncultured Enorma sp.]
MTLGVFRDVRFCIDLVNMALVFLAMAAYTFIFPYYLQEARGIGAGAAGLIMACYPLVNSIVALFRGRCPIRWGAKSPRLWGRLSTPAVLPRAASSRSARPFRS